MKEVASFNSLHASLFSDRFFQLKFFQTWTATITAWTIILRDLVKDCPYCNRALNYHMDRTMFFIITCY